MSRPQFTVRALLVAMLAVGLFLAGFVAGRRSRDVEYQHDLRTLHDKARLANARAESDRAARHGLFIRVHPSLIHLDTGDKPVPDLD